MCVEIGWLQPEPFSILPFSGGSIVINTFKKSYSLYFCQSKWEITCSMLCAHKINLLNVFKISKHTLSNISWNSSLARRLSSEAALMSGGRPLYGVSSFSFSLPA